MKAGKMDVVYPLRKNSSSWKNNELRYSLRSLVQYGPGFRNIVIIGDLPAFVENVRHIAHSDPYPNKQSNVIDKLLHLSEGKKISADFILMNDDFFFLQPAQEIQTYTIGDIMGLRNFRTRSRYGQAIRNTYTWLKKRGLPLRNYEVHYPFIYNTKKFKTLFSEIDYIGTPVLHRSLYGNYYGLAWTELKKDFKIYRNPHPRMFRDPRTCMEPFISTSADIPVVIKKFFEAGFPLATSFEVMRPPLGYSCRVFDRGTRFVANGLACAVIDRKDDVVLISIQNSFHSVFKTSRRKSRVINKRLIPGGEYLAEHVFSGTPEQCQKKLIS